MPKEDLKTIRIAMWSGPRNISTALLRSFENRPDTFVTDEPFYAHYLYKTGENHPLKDKVIKKGETNWDMVVKNIIGDIPFGKTVWYQKHMAQHNLPGYDLKWIEKLCNIILIRHPMDVISSYIKKYEIRNILQLGYPQQFKLFNFLINNIGDMPTILDARDVLNNPESLLLKLCNKIDIPFYKEMLFWPSGHRESDGIWGEYWYDGVESSTGFHPYAINRYPLPAMYKEFYEDCMEYYQHLYQHRMR